MTLQEQADTTFLALCVWREARGESREGKVAVAHSVTNRLASSSWGNTVMSVLFQRLQYSSLTYQADSQLTVWPKDDDKSWQECLSVADAVIHGEVESPIGKADSYHDTSIKPPDWATKSEFVSKIGRLMFYRVSK